MKQLVIDHNNGHETIYQLIEDGANLPLAYHVETSKAVIDALEYCRKNRIRVKLNYGDIDTGKSWNEEHGTTGYISMSKGNEARFPILVHNERSYGGGGLMDNCILKIQESKGGRIYYKATNFQQTTFEIVPSDLPEYTHNVNINGKLYSRHRTERAAKLLVNKLS